jgi:hypothetical protein
MILELGMLVAAAAGLSALGRSSQNSGKGDTDMIYYRTKDGRADYGFSIEQQNDGSLRAYIENMPSYGSRDTSLLTTHRLTDGNRHYVCWSKSIYDPEAMKSVVALWSDATQKYIRTGTTIDQQMRRR